MRGFAALVFHVQAVKSACTRGKKTPAQNAMRLQEFAFTRKQNAHVNSARSRMAHMLHWCESRASARVATRIASTMFARLIVASAENKPFAFKMGKKTKCIPCDGKIVCEHKKQRNNCIACARAGICEHLKVSRKCQECLAKSTKWC